MKSITQYIREDKIVKKYYVGHATATSGPRSLDYVTGPYETLDDAKVFLTKLANEYGLNNADYEWSTHINIYKSTNVDYIYVNDFTYVGTGKSRKVKFTKGKHGGYRIIPVKRNDIEHVSEKEFIERIKNEYDT